MEKVLSESEIMILRQTGTIKSDEIALRIGDLIVAENVLTKQRRILETTQQRLDAGRARILKG